MTEVPNIASKRLFYGLTLICLTHHARHVLQDFYGNMSENIAMLTLFDTHRYFHDAASSTIVVAMSIGLPLIVEPGFLEVYTFVDAGAVIVAEHGDYAGALDKLLKMTPEQWGNLAMEVRSGYD